MLVTCHTWLQGSLGVIHTGASSTKGNGFWGAVSNLCHRLSLGRGPEGHVTWVRMAFVGGTSKKRRDLQWTSLWGGPGLRGGTLLANAFSPGLPHLWSEVEGSILPHQDQEPPQVPVEPLFQKHRRVSVRLTEEHRVLPCRRLCCSRWVEKVTPQ